jgi:branched-chain amino acid transport system substrate-binding protein
MPNSGTALAVQEVARNLKKINITSTAGSLALTGKSCGPTSFHWMWDTYSNSYGLVKALSKKKLDTWFFITADYAFGHALEADFRKAIEQMGGKTLGSVKHPVGMQDFSSLILAAQASKARGVVVASGGNDIVNTLKSANEFGLQKAGISFVAPATFLTDVKSMGLDIAQGPHLHHRLHLDLRRHQPRLRAEVLRAAQGHADDGAGGRVFRHAAIICAPSRPPIRSTPPRSPRRCASCRSAMPSSATARSGRTAGWCMTCTWSRSAVPASRRTNGTWRRCQDVMAGNDVFRPLSESDCPLVKK